VKFEPDETQATGKSRQVIAFLRDGSQERVQETKDWIQSQVPIKRFGTPEEIAAGFFTLTSSESAFVLGGELIIDGGMATL
jgi:NAD(P)-dependent dehydrogenase (short-subunit alcohol dehydrogenase family)